MSLLVSLVLLPFAVLLAVDAVPHEKDDAAPVAESSLALSSLEVPQLKALDPPSFPPVLPHEKPVDML